MSKGVSKMNNYPEVVAKIANDYLERVKLKLRLVRPMSGMSS